MTITFDDPRTNDIYVVYLTPTKSFDFALRYLDGIGSDPIHYSTLSEVPQPHRNAILCSLPHPSSQS